MSTEIVVPPPAPAPIDPDETVGLVRLAIEQKVPVEVLERLVALQERVTARNARMAFVRALMAFRAECPQPQRTKENAQFSVTHDGVKKKSMYAPLEELERVARPVGAKHGLTWTWNTRFDGAMMHVDCKVLHVEGESETSTVSMPYESKSGASAQQKYAITQTYGMRYSMIAALGLTSTDEDHDGNDAGEAETITEYQAAELAALADEVGADKTRFLSYLGVATFADLPTDRYAGAVAKLEAKRGRK